MLSQFGERRRDLGIAAVNGVEVAVGRDRRGVAESPQGRHFYACHLTLDDQPQLRELVADLLTPDEQEAKLALAVSAAEAIWG